MDSQSASTPDRSTVPRGTRPRRPFDYLAFAEVFARRGFSQTSMDELAAQAKVAKPTLYRHFGGKDELMYLQVVPADVVVHPGESVTFTVRGFDAHGIPFVWRGHADREALDGIAERLGRGS